MHNLMEIYLHALYRVLHYLKGSLGKGILCKRSERTLMEVHNNVDYAISSVDLRSTTIYSIFIAKNLTTWRSKKKSMVARSCKSKI